MNTSDNIQTIDEQTSGTGLRDIMAVCIAHWRWYVATVLVALFVAVLYVKKTQPVYQREASIMVLERNRKPAVINEMLNDYMDFGFFSDNTNASNVIAAIKSPDVMLEVVNRLGLYVSYTTRGTFYDKTLYGKQLPVKVVFHDIKPDETASLHIGLTGDGTVEMSDFVKNGKGQDTPDMTCNVGQTVSTPVGRLTIERQEHYASAVAGNDEIDVRKTTSRDAAGRFIGGLSVEIGDKKSTILELSYRDVSGERAEDILAAVIDIYNKVWIKNRNEAAAGATRFLDERLAIIERELDSVDSAVFHELNLPERLEIGADILTPLGGNSARHSRERHILFSGGEREQQGGEESCEDCCCFHCIESFLVAVIVTTARLRTPGCPNAA